MINNFKSGIFKICCIVIAFAIVILFTPVALNFSSFAQNQELATCKNCNANPVNAQIDEQVNEQTESNDPLTTARGMVVCEQSTGRVLYSKDADLKLPMASLTKIITAIVVIENNEDLDEIVTIPKEATGIEGSTIYLKEGEHLTISELLYGLMLTSGNDAAVALAIATSGSVDEFIKLANEFCKNIGAENTNLVTPNGLHDDNHYTTAGDLAKITCYALNNPVFAEIVSTKSTTISNETKPNENRLIKNKNKLLVQMEGATGVKTGYTKKAGRCFVGSAKRNGMQLVCVLLDCNPMFEECWELLEKGFSEYSLVDLLEAYSYQDTVNVTNSNTSKVNVYSRNSFIYPLTLAEKSNIHIEKSLPETIKAPVSKNQEIGKIEIRLGNDLIFCEKIYTIDGVEANDFKTNFDKVIDKM